MGLCQRKRVKHAAASSGTVHLLVPSEFPSDDGEVQTELEERGVCGGAFDAVNYAIRSYSSFTSSSKEETVTGSKEDL